MLFAYSDLHNPEIIDKLKELFKNIPSNYLSTVAILTGGAEEKFIKAFKNGNLPPPIVVLAHRTQNSLPAAAEIMAYLHHRDIPSKLFLLPDEINELENVNKLAKLIKELDGKNIGVLDEPSPWLISASTLTPYDLHSRWGLTIKKISWKDFMDIYKETPTEEDIHTFKSKLKKAEKILVSEEEILRQIKMYKALRILHEKNNLIGLTVKCFHLLKLLGSVPCLAFSLLNSEDKFILGCEGDIPALVAMIITKLLTGKSGFIANLNWFLGENKILMSHCTSPISLLERFYITTHFESEKGAAIKGYFPTGMKITLLKILPNGKLWFSPGTITDTTDNPNICRTQVVIKVDENTYSTLKTGKLGNHSVLVPGDLSPILKHLSWIYKDSFYYSEHNL